MKITTPLQLAQSLAMGRDCELSNDLDMTGFYSLPVKSVLDLQGYTITSKELYNGAGTFLFNLDGGVIRSGIIVGHSREIFNEVGKYFGAVTSKKGDIEQVQFYNCDKWAIRVLGDRMTATDVTTIHRCKFRGMNREGLGYGVWNQYGTVVITESDFDDCRHFLDGGSEASSYLIQKNTFGERHNNYAINLHDYGTGSRSGAGMIISNNLFFGKTSAINIHLPFTGATVIEGNKFECSLAKVGTISGKPLAEYEQFKNNTFDGVGMLPAPSVDGKVAVNKGEVINLRVVDYKKYETDSPDYSVGIASHKFVGLDVAGRSLMTQKSVVILESEKYVSFALKCMGSSVEVWQDGRVIDLLTSSKWERYFYKGSVELRVLSGTTFLDDYCRDNVGETFEVTNKIKVYGATSSSIKSSRFLGEAASGLYSFRFVVPSGESVRVG